jgi:hypothetical protein
LRATRLRTRASHPIRQHGRPINARGSCCRVAEVAPSTRGDHGARLRSPPHRRAGIMLRVCTARPINARASWCASAQPAPSTRGDHGARLRSPPHRRAGIMVHVCTARPINALGLCCRVAEVAPSTCRDHHVCPHGPPHSSPKEPGVRIPDSAPRPGRSRNARRTDRAGPRPRCLALPRGPSAVRATAGRPYPHRSRPFPRWRFGFVLPRPKNRSPSVGTLVPLRTCEQRSG